MTLHDRTTKSLLHLHKHRPPSISAQFQVGGPAGLGALEPYLASRPGQNAQHRAFLTVPSALTAAPLAIWGGVILLR